MSDQTRHEEEMNDTETNDATSVIGSSKTMTINGTDDENAAVAEMAQKSENEVMERSDNEETLELVFPFGTYRGQVMLKRDEGQDVDPDAGTVSTYPVRHGQGCLWYNNGNRHDGRWVDGAAHGYGSKYYANGDCYSGDWVDGRRVGRGTYVFAVVSPSSPSSSSSASLQGGVIYEGEYRDDMCAGYGVLTTANGDTYRGQWLGGRRHGQGIETVTVATGSQSSNIASPTNSHSIDDKRESRTENDDEDKRGERSRSSHGAEQEEEEGIKSRVMRLEGEWRRGKKHGPFSVTHPDGSVTQEEFRNDKRISGGGSNSDNNGEERSLQQQQHQQPLLTEDATRELTAAGLDPATVAALGSFSDRMSRTMGLVSGGLSSLEGNLTHLSDALGQLDMLDDDADSDKDVEDTAERTA